MSASIESTLSLLCLVANLFAILRLLQLNLARIYPVLFFWLCAALPNDFAVAFWGPKNLKYFYTYIVSEPVLGVFYLLVVWELFSVIFEQYKGLRSLSRWVMGLAAAISAAASLAIMAVTATPSRLITRAYLRESTKVERAEASALVFFILILLFFISRYPIKLPSNNVVHSGIYSFYFLTDAAGLLLVSSLSKQNAHVANEVLVVFQAGCYVAWGVLLSQQGEERVTKVRQKLTPERERVLIGELDALNETLLRASRSIGTGRSSKSVINRSS